MARRRALRARRVRESIVWCGGGQPTTIAGVGSVSYDEDVQVAIAKRQEALCKRDAHWLLTFMHLSNSTTFGRCSGCLVKS